MKKFSLETKKLIAFLVLTGLLFFPPSAVEAFGIPFFDISSVAVGALSLIAGTILKLLSLLTQLSGTILNEVVQFTIVDMSDNITKLVSINQAWTTVRDLGNMFFIFILLYAAITTIIGREKNVKRLIVNMIVAAILVNFSLFITKVLIDFSNIISITFYEAIAPGAAAPGVSSGLSDSFVKLLGISQLFNFSDAISFEKVISLGLMGSILLLISAFVFFAVSIMFLIRFITLIFLMILSPIAFLGGVLPNFKTHSDKWWGTLSSQLTFAPVYFFITWISLTVLDGVVTSLNIKPGDLAEAFIGASDSAGKTVAPTGAANSLIGFGMVIGFLIASLIISKGIAGKSHAFVGKATSWATGVGFNAGGWAGRKTFGRAGATVGNSEYLKDRAVNGNIAQRASARLALAAGRKTGTASFDARNAPMGLGATFEADKPKKDTSYAKDVKDRADKASKEAKNYKPSDEAVARAKEKAKDANDRLDEARKKAQADVETTHTKPVESPELVAARTELEEAKAENARLDTRLSPAENKAKSDRVVAAQEKAKKLEDDHQAALNEFEKERKEKIEEQTKPYQDEVVSAEKNKTNMETAYKDRTETLAKRTEKSIWGRIIGGNPEAAKAIRKSSTEKTKKEKAAEAAKELFEEEEAEKKKTEGSETPISENIPKPEEKSKPTDGTV